MILVLLMIRGGVRWMWLLVVVLMISWCFSVWLVMVLVIGLVRLILRRRFWFWMLVMSGELIFLIVLWSCLL